MCQISQQKFSKLTVSPHLVCRKFEAPFYKQSPCMAIASFIGIFSKPLTSHIFLTIHSVLQGPNPPEKLTSSTNREPLPPPIVTSESSITLIYLLTCLLTQKGWGGPL